MTLSEELDSVRAWGHVDERNTMIQIGNNRFVEHGSIEQVVAEKHTAAERIASRLALRRLDQVLEIGSGLGIHTAWFADRAKSVQTIDISDGFKEYFDRFCGDRPNVKRIVRSFFPMLADIQDSSIDCGFSTAVFCHLHIYDIALYFEELAAKLKSGGRFYVNFQNADNYSINDFFNSYLDSYRSVGRFTPIHPAQMQFHSRDYFRAIGMKYSLLVELESTNGSYTEMVFQRRA